MLALSLFRKHTLSDNYIRSVKMKDGLQGTFAGFEDYFPIPPLNTRGSLSNNRRCSIESPIDVTIK